MCSSRNPGPATIQSAVACQAAYPGLDDELKSFAIQRVNANRFSGKDDEWLTRPGAFTGIRGEKKSILPINSRRPRAGAMLDMISDYRRPPSRSIDGVIAAVPASHSSCEERLDQVPMPSQKEVDAAMTAAATLIPEPMDPNIHSENAILTSRL